MDLPAIFYSLIFGQAFHFNTGYLNWIKYIPDPIVTPAAYKRSTQCFKDPDYKQDTCQIIRNKGYPCENYTAVTDDGYMLTLHRIPNGNGYKGDSSVKPVLFLQHGISCSSKSWCVNYPNQSLSYLAYDRGYDVWMGNFRGNEYSRKHKNISNLDPKFWDFSWEEIGLNDLPKMIDFVLLETKHDALHYTGHSMGTTTMFVLLSSKTEYQKKIINAAMISPVTTPHSMTNPLKLMDLVQTPIELYESVFEVKDRVILSKLAILPVSSDVICTTGLTLLGKACQFLGNSFVDMTRNFNISRVCIFYASILNGFSRRTMIHYQQGMIDPVFKKYDYGRTKNMQLYGQEYPPKFNLSLIKTTIGLFSSLEDDFSIQKDIDAIIRKSIKSISVDHVVKTSNYRHFGAIASLSAPDESYKALFEFLEFGKLKSKV